jgi:hypothetical protein
VDVGQLEGKPQPQERTGSMRHAPCAPVVSQHSPLVQHPVLSMSQNSENPVGKYGERAHSIHVLMLHELPHQKPQCEKHLENSHKGKRVQPTQHKVEYSIIWIEIHRWGCEESPPESGISLSLIIPIPRTHRSKDDAGNDLVNKSARLSQDLVCKILTSFIFCSSCA